MFFCYSEVATRLCKTESNLLSNKSTGVSARSPRLFFRFKTRESRVSLRKPRKCYK